ncbi:hypothetical protein KCU95_g12541, partial [Aureobasidium melanogenum]
MCSHKKISSIAVTKPTLFGRPINDLWYNCPRCSARMLYSKVHGCFPSTNLFKPIQSTMAASDFTNTGAPVNPFTSWSNGSVTHNGGKCVMQKNKGSLVMASCTMSKHNGSLVMASCTMSRHNNGSLVMASCTLQNN